MRGINLRTNLRCSSHRDNYMIANLIEKSILKVLQDLKLKAVKFSVEHPENMAWGDFSTNAGIITHQPQEICARLKTEKTLAKIASKIEVAGLPGYQGLH